MNTTNESTGRLAVSRGALGLCALAAALFTASPAFAQAGSYNTTTVVGTFEKLEGGTPVGVQSGSSAAGAGATISLGFPFKFYGQSYSAVYANTVGQVLFGTTYNTYRSGSTLLGDSAAPNSFAAIWWDDSYGLAITQPTDFTYKVTGVAGNHTAVIQWDNWGYYYNLGRARTCQVVLKEATRTIELRYGPIGGGSSYEYAQAGLEDQSGANPVNALACNSNGSSYRGCRNADWPTSGTTVSMQWATTAPDLYATVEVTGVRPVTASGTVGLEMTLKTTVLNLGKTAVSSSFDVDFYQSTDSDIDPAKDTKIGTHVGVPGIAALGKLEYTDTVFIPRPANGEVFVGAHVDPAGIVTNEADKTNNKTSADPFVVGTDLVAKSVTGPATVGLLDPVALTASVQNRGSDPATADFSVYLSSDANITATDVFVGKVSLTLNGFESKTLTINGTVPANMNASGTDMYWGLVADPAAAVTETSKLNNAVAATAKVLLVLPDLKIENLAPSATEYYFGEKGTVTFDLVNQGDADAHNVSVGVLLSDNAVITLSDNFLTIVDNFEVAKKSRVSVTVPAFAIPVLKPDGTTPYPSGDYFFGIMADPARRVPETGEGNNTLASTNLRFRQPAPDFQAQRVDGPAAAASGEVVSISRIIRNIGNRGNDTEGRAYGYRYYLSENEIISVEDRPLPLVVGGVEVESGSGRLGVGGEDKAIDLVRLPPNLVEGDYFLGMVVDPNNDIDELREDNNVIASGALVRVVGSTLTVVSTWLPDATTGVPYAVGIGARGGSAPYNFALVPGQGDLPAGMTLTADGLLTGTPKMSGSSLFTVEVTSGALVTRARFLLRVFPPTGSLQITTAVLPLAVETKPYGNTSAGAAGVQLAATGGIAPYSWTLASGSLLPMGMTFNGGRIAGTPSAGTAGDYKLRINVKDALGATVGTELSLGVLTPTSLGIDLTELPPDGVAGQTYTFAVKFVNARTGFKVVTTGALPEGVTLSTGGDRAFITGKPVKAGAFPFTLTVSDSSGASASRSLVIVIRPAAVAFKTSRLPDASRGQTYEAFVEVESTERAAFKLANGSLPPGLALDESGSIRGTIAEDAPAKSYDFVVEATDKYGSVGLVALSIYVRPPAVTIEAPPVESCGCSAGADGALPFGALALLGLVRRRKARA